MGPPSEAIRLVLIIKRVQDLEPHRPDGNSVLRFHLNKLCLYTMYDSGLKNNVESWRK